MDQDRSRGKRDAYENSNNLEQNVFTDEYDE